MSMVIPCRNESGNIDRLFATLEKFPNSFEFIFIEGNSTDGTYEKIEENLRSSNILNIKLMKQSGHGKFNAVYEATLAATFPNIAIWDSDLTIDEIDQELLISVYLLQPNRPKFVTANRLNPQIEDSAMRSLNRIGNHLFSRANNMVTKTNIPDVLSGTKIFPRELMLGSDICSRAMQLDPFGDLFLISRASYFELHIISINCEYKSRDYGETKIRRWSGGWAMCKFLLHLNTHKCHNKKAARP